ncbi:MAG: DUF167 domain-containing protein [Limisphaerales bacterium]
MLDLPLNYQNNLPVDLPSYFRADAKGFLLFIKLQPRASRTAVSGTMGNELKISVTAPPVDAAANQALIEFLADTLQCPRSQIKLLRGHTSRHKTVLIAGVPTQTKLKCCRGDL